SAPSATFTLTAQELPMESRLDAVAKALAEPLPRREALRRIGSILAAGLFGWLSWAPKAQAFPDPCAAPCSRCPHQLQRQQCYASCIGCVRGGGLFLNACTTNVCCPGPQVCGGICCPGGTVCLPGVGCCLQTQTCGPTVCCQVGTTCTACGC